jgi:UDP-N-acetylglucosamine:LPS N-acetylglucosamine transferase
MFFSTNSEGDQCPKVLAVASGGGHWKQLLRLRVLLDRYQTTYVTTIDGLPQEAGIETFRIVNDISRQDKIKMIKVFALLAFIVFKVRPNTVISTGAAPGLIVIILGRLIGARTLWIDSIANGDELSLSGRAAKIIAHKTISQWKGVAEKENVDYWGQLL